MRVAVVGAGRWGRVHAQKLASLPGVRVVAVVDVQRSRAQELAQQLSAQALGSVHDLPAVDAITVAVPIAELAAVSTALLRYGVPLLIEKPFAQSAAQAQRVIAQAQAQGVGLAVGFVERFNPAVPPQPASQIPLWVARRVGPQAPAQLGLDWLIHDLDLALWRLGPLQVVRTRRSAQSLGLRLRTEAGVPVSLFAGASAQRSRRVWVGAGRPAPLDASGYDALGAQMRAFLRWAAGGAAGRLAMASAALDCLRLLEARATPSLGPRVPASVVRSHKNALYLT